MQRFRTQIDDLSFQYIQNLNDGKTFILSEVELAGLPPEFLKVQYVSLFFEAFSSSIFN